MSIQTNFRAQDMLGVAKPKPKKVAPAPRVVPPAPKPEPVVETVVEPVAVVEDAVVEETSEKE